MTDRTRHFRDRPNRIQVIDDERKQALYLMDFELVPPEAGILDAPYKCYRINDEWAKIVFGLVSWLADIAPWKDPPYEDNHPGILEILKFLSQNNVCGDLMLRQNTTNPCLLEQSNDGGVTWTTAFDYSLCIEPADYTDLINQIIDLRRQVDDLYDGTIASVAPNVIGDGTAYDSIREDALCDTVYFLVVAFCYAELEKRELADGVTNLFQAVVDILTGLVGGVVSVDITPLSETISRLIFEGLSGYWSGLPSDVLSNETAQKRVACCMFDAMDVIGFDRDQFRNSADNCGFTVGSDEEQLATGLQFWLDDEGVWRQFLKDYEIALKDAEDGYTYCPCTDEWESVLDLTVSDYGFVFAQTTGLEDWGTYVAGIGLKPSNRFDGRPYRRLTGSWLFDETTITSFRVEGETTKGSYISWAQGYGCYYSRLYNNDVAQPNDYYVAYNAEPTGLQIKDILRDGYQTTADEFQIFFRTGYDSYTGDATITKVTLRGIGIKPAQLP